MAFFWNVTSCSVAEVSWRSRAIDYFLYQGMYLRFLFFHEAFLYPDDGVSRIIWNVGTGFRLCASRYGQVTDFCENGNEDLFSIKFCEFSCVGEELLSCNEGLWCMELISYLYSSWYWNFKRVVKCFLILSHKWAI
jgi:hypothetical protein